MSNIETTSLTLRAARRQPKKAVPKSIGEDLPHLGNVCQIYNTEIKIKFNFDEHILLIMGDISKILR